MYDDNGGSGILGALFLGAMFWLTDKAAVNRTTEAMNQKFTDIVKDAEIEHLREELNKYKNKS